MNMNEQSAANVTTYHVDMKRMMNNKQLFLLDNLCNKHSTEQYNYSVVL